MKKARSENSTQSSESCLTVIAKRSRRVRAKHDSEVASITKSDTNLEGLKPDLLRHNAKGHDLIESENMELGGVKSTVYTYYLKSVGIPIFLFYCLLFTGYEGCALGANLLLSQWADDPLSAQPEIRNKYLIVYGVLGVSLSACLFLGFLCL